ncbi:hypothetical protein XELAEV_18004680mg, partial [Xenopus laevis]
ALPHGSRSWCYPFQSPLPDKGLTDPPVWFCPGIGGELILGVGDRQSPHVGSQTSSISRATRDLHPL